MMKQRPQAGPGDFRHDQNRPGTGLRGWAFGIQQSPTVNFPGNPLVGRYKHAQAAVCEGQEQVDEPDADLAASFTPFDKHRHALENALLNAIDSDTVDDQRDDSWNERAHLCANCRVVRCL